MCYPSMKFPTSVLLAFVSPPFVACNLSLEQILLTPEKLLVRLRSPIKIQHSAASWEVLPITKYYSTTCHST